MSHRLYFLKFRSAWGRRVIINRKLGCAAPGSTRAYDIRPQARAGNEATQAMLIVGDDRFSRIETCLRAAPLFLLSHDEAVGIARRQIEVILDQWDAVCADAHLAEVDRALMWRRQFLNPFAFEGAPPELAALVH